VFALRLVLAHGKGNKKNLTLTVGQGGNGRRWGKKFTVRQWKKRTAKFAKKKRTAKFVFAVRQHKNARKHFFGRAFFSPCVFEKTHGKAPLCRAPEKIRTANI
jgi:hypothetical protein